MIAGQPHPQIDELAELRRQRRALGAMGRAAHRARHHQESRT